MIKPLSLPLKNLNIKSNLNRSAKLLRMDSHHLLLQQSQFVQNNYGTTFDVMHVEQHCVINLKCELSQFIFHYKCRNLIFEVLYRVGI
jgi:hypothetical protein